MCLRCLHVYHSHFWDVRMCSTHVFGMFACVPRTAGDPGQARRLPPVPHGVHLRRGPVWALRGRERRRHVGQLLVRSARGCRIPACPGARFLLHYKHYNSPRNEHTATPLHGAVISSSEYSAELPRIWPGFTPSWAVQGRPAVCR